MPAAPPSPAAEAANDPRLPADDSWLEEVRWDDNGLAPALAQEHGTGTVLTLAWMNRESLRITVREGYATYWSRSRKRLWRKGETSGNHQEVKAVFLDCDADALLLQVIQHHGGACHTGRHTCFYRRLEQGGWKETTPRPGGDWHSAFTLAALERILRARRGADPDSSYTASLYRAGPDAILKKVGEEAAEVLLAAKNESRQELLHETADLCYHLMVMLAGRDIAFREVLEELERRSAAPGAAKGAGAAPREK